jgi:hypothetical protein
VPQGQAGVRGSTAEDYPDVDATFERRLALVLDGLAANLRR